MDISTVNQQIAYMSEAFTRMCEEIRLNAYYEENPTRRERIATAALQGMRTAGLTCTAAIAVIAVKPADALIAELDKEGGK